jgi:nitroreductase/ferredoxin
MSLFTVDQSSCKKDGICSVECPMKIIRLDENSKFPVPISGREELCINCGHCVAVCPYGAISLGSMPVGQCPELPSGWNLTPQQVEYFLKGRRSIRVYKNDPVERQLLEKILDFARYSPSGINRQPVRWLIIYDNGKVRELAKLTIEWMRLLIKDNSPIASSLRMNDLVDYWDKGEDRICRGAPHLAIAYGLKDDITAQGSATIALTYLELSALAFNLGTCWAGYVQMAVNMYPPARELTGISQRCDCLGAMMVGYPRFKYARIPLRKQADIKWK